MRRQQTMRKGSKSVRKHARAVRPQIEGLEARLLLYSDLGDQWTYDSRITYSFMPDGTSVGGVPSALFQTLNAKYATATWEEQIEQAASLWENVDQRQSGAGLRRRRAGRHRRGSARRPAIRRHPHRHRAAAVGCPRRDVLAPAGQRRHRRRRHPVQLQHQLADQFQLRPDDRRGTRIWTRPGPGRVVGLDGRDVRHL